MTRENENPIFMTGPWITELEIKTVEHAMREGWYEHAFFHRSKTITTGEGGMLILDSARLYKRAMFLRDHGRVAGDPYFNSEVAYKYMPYNVQAALGYTDRLANRKDSLGVVEASPAKITLPFATRRG